MNHDFVIRVAAWLLFASAIVPGWLPFYWRAAAFGTGSAILLYFWCGRRIFLAFVVGAAALSVALFLPLPELRVAPLLQLGIVIGFLSLLPALATLLILRYFPAPKAVPPAQ